MSDTPMIVDPVVPQPLKPDGPTAALAKADGPQADHDQQRKADGNAAGSQKNQFASRSMTSFAQIPVAKQPEYDSLIFKAATNNELSILSNYTQSTYIPDFGTSLYILNTMDRTMASTKRWTDNCMGWVPPMSQMYISLLLYVQVARAMSNADLLQETSELQIFLNTFEELYPLSEMWIPGPLVSLFSNISSFWPSTDDQFGNVCPSLPDSPNWLNNTFFTPGTLNGTNVPNKHLPNISVFISRLRTVSTSAANSANQAEFSDKQDSPARCATLFSREIDGTESVILNSPGTMFTYAEQHHLWANAAISLASLGIPADIDTANNTPQLYNDWTSFMRISNNEHIWIGPISAMMAKYSQFWNGSTTLDKLEPNCSPCAAVKLRHNGSTLHPTLVTTPEVTAIAAVTVIPNPNPQNLVIGPGRLRRLMYYTLVPTARTRVDATIALLNVPEAYSSAASVYAINAYDSQADEAAGRQGPFWTLGPDVLARRALETLPGVLSTIVREYHSDSRIQATKQ